jgi:hypothetical protein
MMLDLTGLEIYVRPGITDMRKQVNGLSEIVEQQMNRSAMSGSLFLFCNRDRRLIKCVYWTAMDSACGSSGWRKTGFPGRTLKSKPGRSRRGNWGCCLMALIFGMPIPLSSTPNVTETPWNY